MLFNCSDNYQGDGDGCDIDTNDVISRQWMSERWWLSELLCCLDYHGWSCILNMYLGESRFLQAT
jgi:hypothetical protein